MRARITLLLAILMSVPTAVARGGMPEPLTPRGATIESIYYQIFVAGMIVFLFVMAWLLVAMWRYRANGGAGRETYELERENLKLELAWIAVPLAVVMWVGVISYAGLVDLDEGIDEHDVFMELDITGFQWTWLADYGSGIQMFSDPSSLDGSVADANVFKIPAGQPIRFNITSGDVIHAWHLMDENWATVGLIDANPYGPHKYTTMTLELPLGEYRVQCREMCFNPGHAYMRARVEAVPMGEFEDWLGYKGLSAGVQLAQEQTLQLGSDGFAGVEDLAFVAGDGARAIITVENTDGVARDVAVPGADLLTTRVVTQDKDVRVVTEEQENVRIPAGASAAFAFDVPTAGDFQFTSGGQHLDFSVIEAQLVQVRLDDFVIEPARLTFEAGTTYLVQMENAGAAPHNLWIGQKPDAQSQTAFVETDQFTGGSTAQFVFTPSEAGTFDMWCNVAGHWDRGMRGQVVVQ